MPAIRRSQPRRRPVAAPGPSARAGGSDRLDPLLALATDWYWTTGADLRYTMVQARAGLRSPLPPLGSQPWDLATRSASHEPAAMQRRMETHAPFNDLEIVQTDPAGHLHRAHVSGLPVFGPRGDFAGYRGIARDTTVQHGAGQALDASQLQLAAVIEAAMDAVIAVDADGRVVQFNQAASDLFGCSRAQALGAALDQWLPQALAFIRRSSARATGSGPLVRGVALEGRRSSGDLFHVEATISRLEVQGRALYYLAARDLTRAMAAEEARQTLESQLRQSQKVEALGTLAGGIAHDFNNIVAAILGNARLARDGAGAGSPAQAFIGEITNAGQRARDLVQRILSFSRDQSSTRLAAQPLQPLVRESVHMLRAMLPAGIDVVHAEPADPLQVSADATQVNQVLMNLGTNAWQAIGRDRGRVGITVERLGDEACLSVSDDGCGMDPATVDRVFEPFFTTKAMGEGTGLGLPVVHGIVQAHGGRITVDSQPGAGSTFRVWLPLVAGMFDAIEARDFAESAGGAAVAAAVPSGGGRHVVYLDDYPAMVLMATAMLEAQGYRVTGFEDPLRALDWLRSHAAQVDLLVTDHNMPECSGLELAAQVRQLRPGLPVILTSGHVTADLQRAAAALAVRQVFDKPRGIEALCQMVGEVLDQTGVPGAPTR